MTLLYYTTDQVRVSEFASFCFGDMPLSKLRMLELHSFPHSSPACFDILSWNVAYNFVSLYYIAHINFERRQFASVFVGVIRQSWESIVLKQIDKFDIEHILSMDTSVKNKVNLMKEILFKEILFNWWARMEVETF